MITYDQFKDIATSLGYKLKMFNIAEDKPLLIDITSSPYAESGFLAAEYVPSSKCVNHWMNNSFEHHIGPNYDDYNNMDHVKEINTSHNNVDVIRDPEILRDTLTTFTKNWKSLVKDIRLRKIKEL